MKMGMSSQRFRFLTKNLNLAIDHEIDAIHAAYHSLCEKMQKEHINGEIFEDAIDLVLNPDARNQKKAEMTMLGRFDQIYCGWLSGWYIW